MGGDPGKMGGGPSSKLTDFYNILKSTKSLPLQQCKMYDTVLRYTQGGHTSDYAEDLYT